MNIISVKSNNDKYLSQQQEKIDVIKSTLKVYFRDKRTVTILWLKDENIELLNAIVNDTSLQSLFMHFDNLPLLQKQAKNMFNPLMEYSTSDGYLIYENIATIIKNKVLDVMKNLNPRAEIVFLMKSTDVTQLRWFLNYTWKEYGLINVIALNFDEKTRIESVTLNPFRTTTEMEIYNLTVENAEIQGRLMLKYNKERFWDMHQYPLKVFIFEQPMACRRLSPYGYGYADGELIHLLAEKMNFNPVYMKDLNGITYGKQEANGSFSGALGAIEYNEVDIGANIRVITNLYSTKNLLYLRPIGSLKLVYIVPKNYLRKSFIIFPLSFFSVHVVILYIVTFISLTLIYYCIKYCSFMRNIDKGRHDEGGSDLFKIILTLIGIHHSISVKIDSSSSKKRLILGTAFLYAVILSSIFQGNIVKELNSLEDESDIKTFEQLISTPLKLLIHADLSVHIEYFKEFAQNSIFNQLYRRNTIISNEIENPGDFVVNATAALLTLDMYTSLLKIQYFDRIFGEERVEVLPIAVKEFFTSITVPKNSPFIEEINFWLSQFNQAGLLAHQVNVAENDIRMEYIKFVKSGMNPRLNLRILTFNELYPLFYFLLGIYLIGFFVLFGEILWNRKKTLQ